MVCVLMCCMHICLHSVGPLTYLPGSSGFCCLREGIVCSQLAASIHITCWTITGQNSGFSLSNYNTCICPWQASQECLIS